MKNIKISKYFWVIYGLFLLAIFLVAWLGFRLVMWNSYRNDDSNNLIKVSIASETMVELALLDIKNKWYWYSQNVGGWINNKSVKLASDYFNSWNYYDEKDVLVSYNIDSRIRSYSWELSSQRQEIFPLFYIDNNWEHKVENLSLEALSSSGSVLWSIISDSSSISGRWAFSKNTVWISKSVSEGEYTWKEESIDKFLLDSSSSYLVLYNTDLSESFDYELFGSGSFTKPNIKISSLVQIWDVKQVFETDLGNINYLSPLNY